ncbi:Rpn family recombination-promoting nuclease/putative transposase [Vibrio lentus]|nr:Rpn family recombination-promoting nuclease/putative transposase [Vibrio lentus]MCC4839682.1 Rpn family recombination-promoting nuclease/putative transposase [Vibrio lentus]
MGEGIEENLPSYYSDVLYSLNMSQGEEDVYELIEHQS